MNSEVTSSLQTFETERAFAFLVRDSKTNQQGYWRIVGKLDSYYDASMELLACDLKLGLKRSFWLGVPIQEQVQPFKLEF